MNLPKATCSRRPEKGWGAAAQMMKAVADARGWEHGRHRHLPPDRQPLRAETGDGDIRRLFAVASTLHENFYENHMTAADIEQDLADVERLLEKLEALMPS